MGVAARGLQQRVLYTIIVLLTGYIAVDFLANHTKGFPSLRPSCKSEAIAKLQEAEATAAAEEEEVEKQKKAGEEEEPEICRTLQGHLDTSPPSHAKHGEREEEEREDENPWKQLKWIGQPGTCRVKGLLIEKLDPLHNFRRGFSLKFSPDVEDKTHLLPWLLPTRVNLRSRERRVFLDLGANSLSTSLTWFLRMYPLDFTEIHAFEVDEHLLHKPKVAFHEASNYSPPNPWSLQVTHTPGIPQWMLNRISIHYQFVNDFDDDDNRAINITRFIKDELRLQAQDAVIVKMDIEGSEWPILKRWMHDPDMANIVDELFVEVHYDHPSMRGYHWARFAPTKREDAVALLAELRWRGFFAHAWP